MGGLDGTPRLRYEARDTFWVNLIAAIEKRVPLVDEANRSLMQRRMLQAGFMGPYEVRNNYAVRFFLTLCLPVGFLLFGLGALLFRSAEHTSELKSLMSISYA